MYVYVYILADVLAGHMSVLVGQSFVFDGSWPDSHSIISRPAVSLNCEATLKLPA